jgi:hypothetical protein
MDLLFSPLSIKRIAYLALVVLTVYAVILILHPPQACWLIWPAFLLSLVLVGDSFRRRLTAILITGAAIALASFAAADLSSDPFFLSFYLLFATIICVAAGQIFPAIFTEACLVNLFVILAGSINTLPSKPGYLELICIGIAIAGLLQIVFYPYFIRNELKPYLLISLRSLSALNKEIFTCFLDAEYSSNLYLYERRLHFRKKDFLYAICRLREITQLAEKRLSPAEKESHEWWLVQLDALFTNIMDYAELRRRVTDYNTFSVCSDELRNIESEIEECFEAVIQHVKNKKYIAYSDQLNTKINHLEDNYHHVLEVASPEPFAFLLFIQSLNAFSEKLKALYAHDLPVSSHLS